LKKGFYIGCIAGGLLGLAISIGMDLILGDALGGTWSDAVAHDLGALLGKTFDKGSFVVVLGVLMVIGFISAFGSLIGGIFGVIVARLLSFLTKAH
jgi:hypothetical protein